MPDNNPLFPPFTGRLFTVQETATILRVSENTVIKWVKDGFLPAIELPGKGQRKRRRIRGEDIDNILKNS